MPVDAQTNAERTAADIIDKDLLRLLLADDRAAFLLFVLRNQAKMAKQIYERIYIHAEVRDTLEKVFCEIYRKGASFEGRSRLHTWMVSLVRNLVGTQNRKELRARGVYVEWQKPAVPPTKEELTERLRVARQVQDVPSSLRTAWVLCHIRNLSASEAAACIGTTTRAVWQRCYRAKEAMHVPNS